jgi:hypothetical protein
MKYLYDSLEPTHEQKKSYCNKCGRLIQFIKREYDQIILNAKYAHTENCKFYEK